MPGIDSGAARRRDGAPHYTNRIHRDDAAGVLRHLLELESAEDLYVGVDSEPADEHSVCSWIAQQLSVPEPPSAEEGAPAPLRRAGSKRCRNARLLATGYRFRYPSFRDGYAALVAG